jgi:hypothetical protein
VPLQVFSLSLREPFLLETLLQLVILSDLLKIHVTQGTSDGRLCHICDIDNILEQRPAQSERIRAKSAPTQCLDRVKCFEPLNQQNIGRNFKMGGIH